MQLKIHTNQHVILLEHTQAIARQEEVNYATIESNTRLGSCRFRIIDTIIGQVWIGDYDIEESYTLQADRPVTGLLVAIQCTASRFTKHVINEIHFPFQSLSWFAQNSNHLKLSFFKGKGYLLLFSYENQLSFFSGLPYFKQSWQPANQQVYGSNNDIVNLAESILNYPLLNDHLQFYLRIKSEELGVLLLNELDKRKGAVSLPENIIDKMQAIDKLTREDLDRNYSIVDLARHTQLSISNLKKYGKAYFSQTIHQYLLSIKMEEAAKRIADTHESLRDIAYNLGFKNEPNFSAAFKKFYGYPPGHLRKRV